MVIPLNNIIRIFHKLGYERIAHKTEFRNLIWKFRKIISKSRDLELMNRKKIRLNNKMQS